jgi:hypothetical protein
MVQMLDLVIVVVVVVVVAVRSRHLQRWQPPRRLWKSGVDVFNE